ncbi:hypothetical protein H8S21_15230 [Erwinia persicina]|uniref:hypothetical protein n=1 Tax=Erwinia persicina TaxID=55211 RepID=UPI0016543E56|nr:hypothetical protein [Erwinia persicina]MBC3946683.1 hypothetical protein [Erwinia persicina]
MKPIKKLWLSNELVHMTDVNIALELNGCGRGFITAETSSDFTGKMVRLDVGYTDKLLRWFTGYVERSQPAENGYQRLFVREMVGIFDRSWPCSFQHPTLRQIAAWLTENSGLTVSVASAAYADKPIPHFTHSGTGFQLLASLGAAFGVSDYQWYQLPDGDVWLGAAEHALFAGKPVDIPSEFASSAAGGNTMTIPVVQSIRPGVELNGQRVTRVRLHNDDLEITWTPRNRSTGAPLQKTPIQRQIEATYPELASGAHLPKFARVVAPSEDVTSGNFADPFRPRYAVNVQLLDADGSPDKGTPEYPAVPLPVPGAGNDAGTFQFPPVGTLVEIGFTGGRPDKPFVRQTMPEGNSLPDIKPGEHLLQQRAEVSQRITQGGDWVRKTDQTISESSMTRVIEADDESRTLVARETTIRATDKTTVVGKSTLLAGAIEQITLGDYAQAVQGNSVATIAGDSSSDVAGDLMEKIGGIRSSIATAQQQVIAPVVWVGSQQINVMQLMLDTLDVVRQLAQLTAAHTHPDTGQPTNAAAIAQTGSQADTLKKKYKPVIG